jgi:Ca-activated chloride channel family protein
MRRTLARVLLASCLGLAACQSTSAVKVDQAAPDVAIATGSADEETAEVAAAEPVPAQPVPAEPKAEKAEPVMVAASTAAPPPAPPRRPMPADPASSALDLGGDDLSAHLEGKRAESVSAAKPARTRTGIATAYGRGAGVVGGTRGAMVVRREAPSSEAYKDYGTNAWVDTTKDALSTFAVDVDTASYTIARRKLTEGALPPKAAVRVEEFVNYFGYRYPRPDGARPFSVTADLAPSPFTTGRHILRVGVATKPLTVSERKPANLVFLVDVSGSMQSPDKLLLAKRALRILVDNLKDGDTVSLVTYAGSTRVVLAPTGLAYKDRILSSIEELSAGGSTAMASGLELAYQQAAMGLRPGAISRVIVLSDGDANVGNTSHADMLKTIAGHVKEGVTLSTVGFGMGNYKDETMEQLANKGNGNNYYIDGISQARRVFQEQLGGTLEVVAKDVKIQVELDPAQVARYRLVGYENRDVADVDFRNDKVDAGEIGAGTSVTAIYELTPVGSNARLIDPSRYNQQPQNVAATSSEFAFLKMRWKQPGAETSKLIDRAITDKDTVSDIKSASESMRFATAVAAYGSLLRGDPYLDKTFGWDEVVGLASGAKGKDEFGYRAEFIQLARLAKTAASQAALKTPSLGGQ